MMISFLTTIEWRCGMDYCWNCASG